MWHSKYLYMLVPLALSGCAAQETKPMVMAPIHVADAKQALQPSSQTDAVTPLVAPAVDAKEERTDLAVPAQVSKDADGKKQEPTAPAHANTPAGVNSSAQQDGRRFVISVGAKDSSHPFFGVGDSMGFSINGVQGGEIVLVRGEQYILQVNSTPLHDVYLSGDKMGWGAAVIEEGVQGNFIYEGQIVFTPGPSTPDVIYYQCQNHKAMGSRIFVINKGESSNLEALRAKHGPMMDGAGAGGAVVEIAPAEVDKKLAYANLVLMSKPATRVRSSTNPEAVRLLQDGEGLIEQAKAHKAKGAYSHAVMLIDEALRKISSATQMVPSESVKEENRKRYDGLLKTVADLKVTYQDAAKKVAQSRGKNEVVKYDEQKVAGLEAQAKTLAGKEQFAEAAASLQEVDKEITLAINQMLHAQELIYDLKIDTPEGEYRYELDRYLGYKELVPVALREKNPEPGQKMLFESFVNQADALHNTAEDFAKNKKYPEAIRTIQEAITKLRRGLTLLGVSQ
ncbi:MAG: hypothetical protein AB1810_02960 [Pseudomonadota bacterium]